MCYSPQMSAAFAAIAFAISFYFYTHRKQNCFLWIIFLFYGLMEVLQTFQFRTLNQCANKENQLLTFIAMVFVIVQPFLWNWYGYTCRSSNSFQRGVFTLGMVLSVFWIIGYLFRFGKWRKEDGEDVLRGPLCTRKEGDGHFFWTFPVSKDNYISANFFMYLLIWFVPIAFGNGSIVSKFGSAIGITIGWLLAKKNKELASTWCYISVPLLVIGLIDITGI